VIVFFDIGNCLYDPWRTFRRTLRALGRARLADEILARGGLYADQPGRHDAWLRAAGLTAEEIAEYFRRFIHEPVLHAGARETLERLRERGARLGIVSDGDFATQLLKLEAWGLRPFFAPELTFITASASAGRPGGVALAGSKREAGTFRTILARAGAAPPECWMIGDDYVRDALRPVQAGMRAVWFAPNEPARLTRPRNVADPRIIRIASLRRLIDVVFGAPACDASH
jgi:FMN phosphatase YigB (HAD superfamily)